MSCKMLRELLTSLVLFVLLVARSQCAVPVYGSNTETSFTGKSMLCKWRERGFSWLVVLCN